MKKIAILANSLSGLEAFRGELIEELARQYEVIAICPDGRDREKMKSHGCRLIPIQLDRRGMNPWKDFLLLLTFFRTIRKAKSAFITTSS